jgi:hypothetical protein
MFPASPGALETSPERRLAATTWSVPALAALTLLLHLLTIHGYGYFRDELYYLANGEHLGFGYVEHPPFIGIAAAFIRAVLGESLLAIRLLPALCAAATVWLVGSMAREMGGGRYAQTLAALTAMLAPVYVGLFSVLSMNAFDILFWTLGWWLVTRILRTGDERLWLAFGIVAGIGLQNKISVLFLGFGITAGLVMSGRWGMLRSRWLWLGGAVAGAIFLPHVLWQMANGWPTLEFIENARRLKNVALSPVAFFAEQVLQANPLALPVWIGGLGFLLLSAQARRFRPLGWTYPAILGAMLAAGGAKPYYMAASYGVLFAAGGVAIETWTRGRAGQALRVLAVAAVAGGGLLTAPFAKAILPPDTFVRYADAVGIHPSSGERQELGRLPQMFADMHGWQELAESVARVYHALPPEDRDRACIFGQNYGQAGAIDLFGRRLGLPKAISAHNSYYLWGPRGCTGELMIVIGDERERLAEVFARVELGTVHTCIDCMPYENDKSIWIARGLRQPLRDVWPAIKRFI